METIKNCEVGKVQHFKMRFPDFVGLFVCWCAVIGWYSRICKTLAEVRKEVPNFSAALSALIKSKVSPSAVRQASKQATTYVATNGNERD